MLAKTLTLTAAFALLAGAAAAADFEVQMLNKGADGAMVFEPGFIRVQPGDTIHFVATDKGHNVASIDDMLPEGVEPFHGDMGKDYTLTVTTEGLYGVKCTPHAAMGMVALIEVGAPTNQDAVTAAADKLRGKAKERFAADLAQVQ
ncbi:pseudoazurin [Rubellimicrobium arenae]|uniref:pseudoazurin n=1 Tax=Rubellimicrobium arenae TaxID=2817372 RepID=UPI001B3035DD|nr:pseudoazurin [Rubellimicrobium arenae]